jgi:hypothetical protein
VPKREIQKALRVVAGDRGVLEIKLDLAMDIGQVNGIQHAPLFLHFSI